MLLATYKLKYLDLTNYLAAGTSLENFYKAYDVESPKGHFPYEWFDSAEKLFHTSLPTKADFYSTLKKQSISDDDCAQCQKV